MEIQNICPICGSPLEPEGKRLKCRYCGYSKAEETSSEESSLLFVAFQKLRMADFDYAGELFSDILRHFPNSAEAYWGSTLADYGIKYEDDYDGRKIPTCYAAKYESFAESNTYKKAIECATPEQKEYYQSQSRKIDSVRKEWVEKAEKEPPYDVFLSFKDTDEGKRTSDSEEAYEIYNILSGLGYRVFFSRVTLAGKTGENYEPYIFAALNSAPVMLVYASRKEYIESTWVRNEWNRYLARIRIKQKQEGSICVIFKDPLDPSKLPASLRRVQNLKRTEITFLDNLRDYVDKYVSAAKVKTPRIDRKEVALAKKQGQKSIEAVKMEDVSSISVKRQGRKSIEVEKRQVGGSSVAALSASEESKLSQAEIYLSHGDGNMARSLYEDVLSTNPHSQQALVGLLLSRVGAKSVGDALKTPDVAARELDLAATIVDYSDKDVASETLAALCNACLSSISKNDFASARAVYEKISHYDVPIVNELHQKLFRAVIEKSGGDDAVAICKACLPFLSSDSSLYRSSLESAARWCFKAKRYKDCVDFADQYGQYYDFTADLYKIVLAAKGECPSPEEWLAATAEKGDFSSLSGGLPLSQKEIGALFDWASNVAVGMIASSPEIANPLVRFLLPYRFPKREAFIENGLTKCEENPNDKVAKVFDGFLHVFGDDRFKEFISAQEAFVDSCFAKKEYALAAHYLGRLIEYDPGKSERYLLRCCANLGCEAEHLNERIHLLKDYSDVEAMIANRGKAKVAKTLDALLHAAESAANLKEACPVFDSLIGYLPKEEDAALLAHLGIMARACLNASLFDEAERYFSSIVTLSPNDHSAYFGILLAKLHAKNEMELIHQTTPIRGFVEFGNAKLAAGKDRKALEHYIEIELKQTQWIESENARIAKEEEEARKAAELEAKRQEEARKRRAKKIRKWTIIGASIAAAAVAISVIATNVTSAVIKERIKAAETAMELAISAIENRDYDAAIQALNGHTYGESRNLLNMANAGKYFEQKNDYDGVNCVFAAGGVVHAHFSAEHCTLGATEIDMYPSLGQARPTCEPDNGYVLRDWQLTNYKLSIENASYSSEIWLQARIITEAEAAEEEEPWNRAHGITPDLSSDGKCVTYGMYPQDKVMDASLISGLNGIASLDAATGWFLLDDEYYCKLSSDWYAVKPIKWKILERSGDELFVVSDLLLDVHRYNEYYDGLKDGHYANNYKESEVRAWLNADFYSTAFALGNDRILATEVDNSAATSYGSNPYACENTQDKVFLLSYQDYQNGSYGFADYDSRQCPPTDYAVAKGAYKGPNGYGCYWTRSPYYNNSYNAWNVRRDGTLNSLNVYEVDRGVRPAIRITIPE